MHAADTSQDHINVNTVQLNAFDCKKRKELNRFRRAKSSLVLMFAF